MLPYPEELLLLLQKKEIILLDASVHPIWGRRVMSRIRDVADATGSEWGTEDNLLKPPRYKPTPEGPVFLE